MWRIFSKSLVCLAVIALASCQPEEMESDDVSQRGFDFGEVIHRARTVDGCMSNLEIKFYEGDQYVATYSTCVGPHNLVYYAGRYDMGDDFFFLSSPMFDMVSFKADENGIYMPEGYTVEQGMNSGMRVVFESKNGPDSHK